MAKEVEEDRLVLPAEVTQAGPVTAARAARLGQGTLSSGRRAERRTRDGRKRATSRLVVRPLSGIRLDLTPSRRQAAVPVVFLHDVLGMVAGVDLTGIGLAGVNQRVLLVEQ